MTCKFVVKIDSPGVGVSKYQVDAPDSDSAIDQAIQDHLTTERGPQRHLTKLREESLASAQITVERVS